MKKAFIQLHIAVFLAGFTGILGKLITLNEGLLVWYRLLISAVTLWILFSLQRKTTKIAHADILKIFGIGAIAALHWVSFYGSIKYANVSIALVCFSAVGFFTAFLEPLIFRVKMDVVELLLGILMVVGIYFIFHFDPSYKIGIIIGLISALLGSIFPILNKVILKKISAENVTLYELSGGFLFLTLVLPFYLKVFPTDYIFPNLHDWLWLLVLSWICTVLAFNLSMKALQKISAFTVNLSYNLEPVYGILLAFVVLGENKYFNKGFYMGLGFILFAITAQMLRLRNKRKSK
ncbi:MAG TPA: DMT family transporter [Puia sp.]|jgi:drug/metabolite transporter (DMT)-like permease|nr:DMT family transporter [Puia sp.]